MEDGPRVDSLLARRLKTFKILAVGSLRGDDLSIVALDEAMYSR